MRLSIRKSLMALLIVVVVPAFAQDKAAEIDRMLKMYFDYGQFHGAALVAENGQVIYKNGFGMANYEWNIPIRPDTKFRLGSITKQFTAALILQLREEGRVDLDGTLSDYLPYYRNDTGKKVTIHQLLNHTSGIPSYTGRPGFEEEVSRDHYDPKAFVTKYCSDDLQFEPGTQFSYSNSGYFILGAIIEEITGMSYEKALKTRILDPLEMNDTGYDQHESIVKKRATGYAKTPDGYVNAPYLDMSLPYAAGSMYSTVEDLFKWDRALTSEEVLNAESKELMFKPGLEAYGYGFGIREAKVGDTEESVRTISHSGGINGFNTSITRLPDSDSLIVLLGNVEGIQRLGAIRQSAINILNGQSLVKPKWSIADSLLETIDAAGVEGAVKRYHELKKLEPDNYEFSEGELNRLGYRLLASGRVKEAIEMFRLNVEAYPESANAYDSLGEAYLAAGNEELALLNYRKSVELDPENTNGVEAIKRIESVDSTGPVSYVGNYKIGPGDVLTITVEDGTIYGQRVSDVVPMVAKSETEFVMPSRDVTYTFEMDASGNVTAVVISEGERKVTARRMK